MFSCILCSPHIAADVAGLFHRHVDAMSEDQRQVTESQKRINVIHILNVHLQPFSVQISNLIDVPAFIGYLYLIMRIIHMTTNMMCNILFNP
jgi:hypothetical protein